MSCCSGFKTPGPSIQVQIQKVADTPGQETEGGASSAGAFVADGCMHCCVAGTAIWINNKGPRSGKAHLVHKCAGESPGLCSSFSYVLRCLVVESRT